MHAAVAFVAFIAALVLVMIIVQCLDARHDMVLLWVDTRDPKWRALHSDPPTFRTHPLEEIEYAVRSAFVHAHSLVRRVFIVVHPGQRVASLVRNSNVIFVEHPTIIPSKYLPTFNSAAIEMFLHRIPGLSEYFFYGNDDTFWGAPISRSDYFDTSTGKPFCLVQPYDIQRLGAYPNPPDFFTHHCNNIPVWLRRIYPNLVDQGFPWRPEHIIQVHWKPAWTILHERLPELVDATARHAHRTSEGVNQYVFHVIARQEGAMLAKPLHDSVFWMIRDGQVPAIPRTKFLCLNEQDAWGAETCEAVREQLEALIPAR
jgi:hypothetical protein